VKHPTVYLIAQPSLDREGRAPDTSPLAEHGEVVVLIRAGEYPSNNPQKAVKLLWERLQEYNPETDFLAWAGGDTLAAVLVGMVLMDMGHRGLNWLRYDRPKDPKAPHKRTHIGARYVPIPIAWEDAS